MRHGGIAGVGQRGPQTGHIESFAPSQQKAVGGDVFPRRDPVHERAGGDEQDAARQRWEPIEGFEPFGHDALVG